MTLKQYQKAQPTVANANRQYMEIPKRYPTKNNTNLWTTVGDGYGFLQSFVNNYKLANMLVPSFFIFLGMFFIGKHFWPDIQTWAQTQAGVTNQGTAPTVSGEFIDYSQFISNPSGLSDLASEAFDQNVLQVDTVSNNYRGTFYISIPNLGINRLPVAVNVDSTNEDVYNKVLETSLAHFENTGLPISDVKNNIVLYGHSATSNYNPQRWDPQVAFSFLPELRVGDEIILEMEGKTYRYRMYRSKIVEPTDVSIITGEKNIQTLTLFTCYPAGNDAQRYVAIARPIT